MAATTTTASCGSATSASRDRPSPPTGRTRCWTTRVRSGSNRVLEHGARLAPAYPSTVAGLPGADAGPAGLPGGTVMLGNYVRRSSSSTRAETSCSCSRRPPGTTGSTPSTARRTARGRVDRAAVGRRATPACGSSHLAWWTHSRLICVAGLRAVAAAPASTATPRGGMPSPTASSPRPRARVLDRTAAGTLRPPTRTDAALLLAAVRGALPADDPRDGRTVDAVGGEPGRATATSTASVTTAGRSRTPKARSCSAAS